MNRRSFLQASTVLGVGSVVGASALLSACKGGNELVPLKQPGEFYVPELPDKAIDGKELKVGLVGCGGLMHSWIFNVIRPCRCTYKRQRRRYTNLADSG